MSHKRRILHVLPWIAAGGVERRRLQLARGLDPDRFEQRILCKSAHAPLREPIEAAGVQIIELPGVWGLLDLDATARALSLLDDWRPDVIHGAVFEGVVFAALTGYLGRVPHIVVEETGGTPHRTWRGDLMMSAAAAVSERCVAISPHIGRYLTARSRVAPDKLEVITNGVAFPRALSDAERAAARGALGIPQGATVFGSVGRLFDNHKRFSDLIDALALLNAPDVWLLIAGQGPELERYQAQAAARGVAARVLLAGHHADMAAFYGVMDVFALVSAFEGFGLVLPEAMSASLPVIGSRVDAIPDIVVEGQTGLLVPACDPAALARAMRWMLDHPAERIRMGEAGRVRAAEHYSEPRYVESVRVFYESLFAEVRGS